MVTVRVSTEVPVGRERVWAELARIEDHVEWMRDATAVRFRGERRRGIGTTFECDTKVGPIRLTDVMEVIEWESGGSIHHHRSAHGTTLPSRQSTKARHLPSEANSKAGTT